MIVAAAVQQLFIAVVDALTDWAGNGEIERCVACSAQLPSGNQCLINRYEQVGIHRKLVRKYVAPGVTTKIEIRMLGQTHRSRFTRLGVILYDKRVVIRKCERDASIQ